MAPAKTSKRKTKAKSKVKATPKKSRERARTAKASPWAKGKRPPKPAKGRVAGKRSKPLAQDAWPPQLKRAMLTDPLGLIRRVLADRDSFLLRRQVGYRMAMASVPLKVWANAEEVMRSLGDLIEHIVMRSPRRSVISMRIGEFSLRSGKGVEFRFDVTDRFMLEDGHKAFLAALFEGSADLESKVSLANLRERVMHQHGRFWADLPGHNRIVYHVIFPSSREVANLQLAAQRTFRYDITIVDYPMIRKRFGIKKSRHLVEQIESYVKSLVRYPIDMVTADLDSGVISAIYESHHSAAESVPSRISKRLAQETFHIGRRPVDLSFRYQLTTLSRARGGA